MLRSGAQQAITVVMKRAALTRVQHDALAAIVAEFDRANAAEIANWGKPLSGGVALASFELRGTTVKALADAGLVTIAALEIAGSRLRRGAYGRRTSGTKQFAYFATTIRPTDAGRTLLAGKAA